MSPRNCRRQLLIFFFLCMWVCIWWCGGRCICVKLWLTSFFPPITLPYKLQRGITMKLILKNWPKIHLWANFGEGHILIQGIKFVIDYRTQNWFSLVQAVRTTARTSNSLKHSYYASESTRTYFGSPNKQSYENLCENLVSTAGSHTFESFS